MIRRINGKIIKRDKRGYSLIFDTVLSLWCLITCSYSKFSSVELTIRLNGGRRYLEGRTTLAILSFVLGVILSTSITSIAGGCAGVTNITSNPSTN